jgi:urea transport system permease protein
VAALRDDEPRVRFLGYPVEHYKLGLFVLSAMIAGLAGALYVPQVGIINPGEFQPLNSIEIAIWVAVGGRGTLHGAMFGALLVAGARTLLTALVPEAWLFALGALFLLVTLFLPRGLRGSCAPGQRMTDAIDTSHGVILYLEDVSVSFAGYRALDRLSLVSMRASCAA